MARKMTEWPSKRGPITKIMPSDGCIGDTVPLAVGKWYEFHEFGWHMGNVGFGQGARRPDPGRSSTSSCREWTGFAGIAALRREAARSPYCRGFGVEQTPAHPSGLRSRGRRLHSEVAQHQVAAQRPRGGAVRRRLHSAGSSRRRRQTPRSGDAGGETGVLPAAALRTLNERPGQPSGISIPGKHVAARIRDLKYKVAAGVGEPCPAARREHTVPCGIGWRGPAPRRRPPP